MTQHTITVRPATPADADTLTQFNIAMAHETEEITLDPATVRSGVDQVLRNTAHGFYLVAEHAGEVVGSLLVTFEWSDWRNGTLWWIQSVYVASAWRRNGVLRRLYQVVHAEATETPEVCGLRLYVEKDNHVAMATYRHLGMSQTNYLVYETEF
ncbi:MAG: GNAT family N-acetyltransferase [Arenicellales bacterium]|nr:GNAT family N-acetyltransferase [Arenicellales bacterium]